MAALPTPHGVAVAEEYMREAISLAKQTPLIDVPVGAIIYGPDGRRLAGATNRRVADSDPTAHAEILALRAAAQEFGGGWRLTGCTMVVSLEPCAMCAGAIIGARIGTLIFGAFEPKTGACGSVVDLPREFPLASQLEVRGGILDVDCAALLTDFFTEKRG